MIKAIDCFRKRSLFLFFWFCNLIFDHKTEHNLLSGDTPTNFYLCIHKWRLPSPILFFYSPYKPLPSYFRKCAVFDSPPVYVVGLKAWNMKKKNFEPNFFHIFLVLYQMFQVFRTLLNMSDTTFPKVVDRLCV